MNAGLTRVLRLLLVKGRSALVTVLLVSVTVAVMVAGIRSGWSVGAISGNESTDDAYVRADQIAISSHIAGYVDAVWVRDNQTVGRGQLIATIRDEDYRAKIVAAEAALQAARYEQDVLSAQALVQNRKIEAASAEVRAAAATLIQARRQHVRQRGLIGDGTTSQRELESAEAEEARLSAARDEKVAQLDAAKESLQVIEKQELGARQVVKNRDAALALARIDLDYTRIVSPAAGQLSERASLPGEYVTAGSRIGLLVPLPDVWVVANFREVQLTRMHVGQAAVVTVDSVPGTRFQGTIDSFGPASGALQALLPPDNATGNFTKVAQRFAVKVTLAQGQDDIRRLRPGMSAVVTVAVGAGRRE